MAPIAPLDTCLVETENPISAAFGVLIASNFRRLARAADLLYTACSGRGDYEVAQIDLFSWLADPTSETEATKRRVRSRPENPATQKGFTYEVTDCHSGV
jgi:hypothetical protein